MSFRASNEKEPKVGPVDASDIEDKAMTFNLTQFINEASKDLSKADPSTMLYWLRELYERPQNFFQVHDSPPNEALLDQLRLRGWEVKQTLDRNPNVTITWTGKDLVDIPNVVEPISTTIFLDVPYRSQWDADAATHTADCGPTALAMVLNSIGVATTPDTIYARFMPDKPLGAYTSVSELRQAAAGYNVEFDSMTFDGDTFRRLKETIDRNRAVIALVNYEHLDAVLNNFTGAHFVVIVGYDNTNIFIHDPLYSGVNRLLGAFKKWPNDVFLKAWGDCTKQGNPNLFGLVCQKLTPKLIGAPTTPANPSVPLYKAKVNNPNAIGGLWSRDLEGKSIRLVPNGEVVEVFEEFDLNASYPKRARITPNGVPIQHIVYDIDGVSVLERSTS